MARSMGINDMLNKNYKYHPLSKQWEEHIGIPEHGFSMLIYGDPKNGKTEYSLQFTNELAEHGKVFYNSSEQGFSKTMADAIKRQVKPKHSGKVMIGNIKKFEDLLDKLMAKGSGKFIIIDSRDYMGLTADQWKELTTTFKHKSFILVCWESAGKPKGTHAQDILFMVDIVVHVKNYVAHPRSRYGGNKKHTIWDRPAPGLQVSLFNS